MKKFEIKAMEDSWNGVAMYGGSHIRADSNAEAISYFQESLKGNGVVKGKVFPDSEFDTAVKGIQREDINVYPSEIPSGLFCYFLRDEEKNIIAIATPLGIQVAK